MTPREGTLFADRYRLVRKVGGGHVASVWKVLDQETKVFAALKVLSGSMHSHAEALTRFSLEERISSELTGEYFAARVDSGSWQGQRYLAWHWHEGESLRTLFERTHRLDAPTVQSVIEEVASALSVAHKSGILHGDIKPENIHFANARPGQARQLKLFGFGIASRAPSGEKFVRGRRRPGVSVGTPLYMSPDCIMGYLPQDARADLWALGVVTYEALVGRPPFVGKDEATVFRSILQRDAPLPCSLVNLPSSVDRWWKQVLAEEFLTATSFSESLTEALRAAIRSSHTQRSARGFTVPAPTAIADPIHPAQGATGSEPSRPSPPAQATPTGERSGDGRSLAGRGGSRKTSSGLPKAKTPPPPPFVPVTSEPSGFPMDARKTLVGLTPFFLTPDAAGKATEKAPPTAEHPAPSANDAGLETAPGNAPLPSSTPSDATSHVGQRPTAPISVNSSATMPFPRPELVRPTQTVTVGGLASGTAHPPEETNAADCWVDELTATQETRRGDTATVSPQPVTDSAGQDTPPVSEQPGSPTVVLERPAWLESTGLGRLTRSDTVQGLLGSNERRAQLVAAGIICGSAALVMAIISIASESPRQELEHTSLAVQASPEGTAAEADVGKAAEPIGETSPKHAPPTPIPQAAKPPTVHLDPAGPTTPTVHLDTAGPTTSASQPDVAEVDRPSSTNEVAPSVTRLAPTHPPKAGRDSPAVKLAAPSGIPQAAAVTPKVVKLPVAKPPAAPGTSQRSTGLPDSAASAKTQTPPPPQSAPPHPAPTPRNNPTPSRRSDSDEFDFGI